MFSPSIQMVTATSANRKSRYIVPNKEEKKEKNFKKGVKMTKEDYEGFLRVVAHFWK